MTGGYAYDHAWNEERVRLAGLEAALDPGTRARFVQLGAGPGSRCLEVGAGGGSIAFWLAELVAPDGRVVATDLETDFLEVQAVAHPCLEVLKHDITTEALPGDFDFVHARWLVEWLPDKRAALHRMVDALRPGGVLFDEEPDFGTMFGSAEPFVLRNVMTTAMRYLETTCPVECEYGRRVLDDLAAVGLGDVTAEGRCPIVRGGDPPAADFLRLTLEKLRAGVLAEARVTATEFDDAVAALQDPRVTVVMPMTVAAYGRRR
jgi:SAM-dependent methyltransferase